MHDDDVTKEENIADENDDFVIEDDAKTPNDKLKALREKLRAAEKERDDNLAGWQRARADMVNCKRQAASDSLEQVKYAAKNVLLDLLPVLDSFDMAMMSPSWESTDSAWRKGIEGVYQQALTAAGGHGLHQFEPKIGEVFDGEKHEPVGTEVTDDDQKEHTIAKVLQKGYELHGSIIRPAKVIIFTKE
jgi:molecular chaperone GrpE